MACLDFVSDFYFPSETKTKSMISLRLGGQLPSRTQHFSLGSTNHGRDLTSIASLRRFTRLRGFGVNVRQFIPCLRIFFFQMEISSHTLIPLFMPQSVNSGTASWDNYDQVFPDEFCAWACFLIGSHTIPGQWHSQPTLTLLGQRCMHV